jgi:hypothetical protein
VAVALSDFACPTISSIFFVALQTSSNYLIQPNSPGFSQKSKTQMREVAP